VKNKERIRERYLRDPLPTRLAGLASTLSKVSSSARRESAAEVVVDLLEEGQYFIEWTAAEAEPEIAGDLVNIQVMLSLWRNAWPEAQHSRPQRSILSVQAKLWSDQVLRYAGFG
jgi:hypothetical protein